MLFKAPRGFISENDPRVSVVGHAAPPWLINYADLMTELSCFFLMIYALSFAFSSTMQKVYKNVVETMEKEKIVGEAKMTKEGLRISLEEKESLALFKSGSAELLPEMKSNIDKIVPALRQGLSIKTNMIVVEGHTDNVPIFTSKFASNWELSTARATNVVKYLLDVHGFPPDRIAAIGYGEYKPIAPNDTEENRAKNRRVVFLIKVT
jgi:chemotaxis protein MotB